MLSPMDEFGWFQPPQVSLFTLAAGVTLTAVKQNSMRVGIIFAGDGANVIYVVPQATLPSGGPVGGIPLTSANGFATLTQRDWGSLVQWEWHAVTNAVSAVLCVIEVLIRDWPRVRPDSRRAGCLRSGTPISGAPNPFASPEED